MGGSTLRCASAAAGTSLPPGSPTGHRVLVIVSCVARSEAMQCSSYFGNPRFFPPVGGGETFASWREKPRRSEFRVGPALAEPGCRDFKA
eukprot:5132181-Prymnesium_polylepis.1